MFDYETFRINLKMRRKLLKVTQEDIANAIDVSEKTISRLEQTSREPSLPIIIGILNYFNCTVEQFMNGQDDSEKQVLIRKINGYVAALPVEKRKMFLNIIKEYNRDTYDRNK